VPKEVMVMIGGIGGSDGQTVLQSMDSYDPRKNRWTSLPNLPVAVTDFSATAFGNDIFVIGGEIKDHVVGRCLAIFIGQALLGKGALVAYSTLVSHLCRLGYATVRHRRHQCHWQPNGRCGGIDTVS